MFALPQGGKPRRFDRRVLAAVLLVAGGPILGTPPALHVQSPSRSAGASDLSDPFSSVLCSLSAGEEPLPNYCKDSVKMHPFKVNRPYFTCFDFGSGRRHSSHELRVGESESACVGAAWSWSCVHARR